MSELTLSTPTASAPAAKPSLMRLLALLKPYHGRYVLALTLRVAITAIERTFIGYLVKIVIDGMMSGDANRFYGALLYWVYFYAAYAAVGPFVIYLWRSSIVIGTANIREVVFRHLQRLPLGYHELHHSGQALSILTNDVSAAEKAYQNDLLSLTEPIAQGIAGAALMLALNWQLSLVIMLGGVMPLIINTLFAKPLRKAGDAVQASLGDVSERMTDLLAGFQVIRTFNLGDWILSRFDRSNAGTLERSIQRVNLETALAGSNEFGGMFTMIPILFGGYLVLIGQTTLGTMVALIQLSNNINNMVYSLGGAISRVQAALAAADRVLALLDSPAEPERYALTAAGGCPATTDACIAFNEVTFGYNGDQDILNGLTFQAAAGQVVAFAGPSGGGKSTILKLLLGCYPIRQGLICVDGRPIPDYRLEELRDRMAYVPQDAYLFAGTIYDNIRYGKPAASEAEITTAAQAAFAHDFIMEFPNGYQTVVGERGARLSGGQRQRIAIARALLKDAPILLLDEATSALDSESEAIVQQALEVLMQGRTTLVIAHRLSTILNADQIYVIEGGRVVEQGRHADLLALQGVYANLFELQYQAA